MYSRALLVLSFLFLVPACRGAQDDGAVVFAAASLIDVFEELEPDAVFNFGGSDDLALQIREGATPDVFASASTTYPDELYDAGLVERPRIFATNRLVLVVPSGDPAGITSLADVAGEGIKLVIGNEGVPIGQYTRALLRERGLEEALGNVVSEEDDVRAVLGKVRLGEADAGFVYASDVWDGEDGVRVIQLGEQEEIGYAVAVVNSGDEAAGRAFVSLLAGSRGRAALTAAGFGTP